jgi:hypothetical protein
VSGKGDTRRPGDEQAYREGWDRIFARRSAPRPLVWYCPDCVCFVTRDAVVAGRAALHAWCHHWGARPAPDSSHNDTIDPAGSEDVSC